MTRPDRPRRLHVSLVHGLGNQLCQVAAGLDLARRFNAQCQFSLPFAPREQLHDDSILGLSEAPLLRDSRFRVRRLTRPLEGCRVFRRARSWSWRTAGRLSRRRCIDDFENCSSRHDLLGGPRPWIMRGYFQDGRHIDAILPGLRSGLTPPLGGTRWDWVKSIRNSEQFASATVVHVRGGDYPMKLRLGRAYYSGALDVIANCNGVSDDLYVISDDFEWAERVLSGLGNLIHLLPPSGASQVQELLAASSAGSFVAANSTFSLWVGLLLRPGVQVVYPAQHARQTRLYDSQGTRNWTSVFA